MNLPSNTNFKFFEKKFSGYVVWANYVISYPLHPTFEDHFPKKCFEIFFQRPQVASQKSFLEKVKFQDFGSRRIKSFPINCTPLLRTIFQKNILWKLQRKNTLKFLKIFEEHFPKCPKSRYKKVFWKMSNFRILDLGKLTDFLSVATPYFLSGFFFWGPLGPLRS